MMINTHCLNEAAKEMAVLYARNRASYSGVELSVVNPVLTEVERSSPGALPNDLRESYVAEWRSRDELLKTVVLEKLTSSYQSATESLLGADGPYALADALYQATSEIGYPRSGVEIVAKLDGHTVRSIDAPA